MKVDFEGRLANVLSGLASIAPETKQEASRMTTQQWASFQKTMGELYAVLEEVGGRIFLDGAWIQVGRFAAEQVNNAAAVRVNNAAYLIGSGPAKHISRNDKISLVRPA
jgi:hypothetical protein